MLKTAVLFALACSMAHTQTSEKRLAFDAASIKPVEAPEVRGPGMMLALNGGGFLEFTRAGVSATRVTTGLKFVAGKAAVDVLVIDRIEQPEAN
jgi:hypothetical protein